jgi:hypothetical protein
MTLDELRLRIGAAFPPATMTYQEGTESLLVEVPSPLDLEVGAEPILAFEVWVEGDGTIVVCPHFLDDEDNIATRRDWRRAEREIERRIREVTAHQLVEARRRRAFEELAHLDADLITDEPPTETPA